LEVFKTVRPSPDGNTDGSIVADDDDAELQDWFADFGEWNNLVGGELSLAEEECGK
jgi:hypothetical protein